MQATLQDCKKLFTVPSFSVILLAESIAAVGASGTGYQVLYIEVSPSVHTSKAKISHLHVSRKEVQKDDALTSKEETLLIKTLRGMCLWQLMHHCELY